LLSLGKYEEVQRRAGRSLELSKGEEYLLDDALDNLSLGRAHLLQSQREPNHPSTTLRTGPFTESLTYLNHAVNGLRQAGQQDELPRGLLARAEFYRLTGALDKAQKDLDEAFSIATRGGMGLFLADCHLEYARLSLAQPLPNPPLTGEGRVRSAWEHLKTAKEMIAKMGYHRRDKEVEELEEQLT
jgi:tetratricopeptide (TPR) repeat protein